MVLIGMLFTQYAYYAGMAGMLIVSLIIFRKLKLKIWQALLFTVVAFLSDGLGAFLMGKVYTAFVASLGSTTEAMYSIYGAVFLTPVLILISSALIKQPWRNIIDMVALSEMTARACGKLGCHIGYCCAGFEWEHGVYNARFETNMFPSQLCEFFTMVVIIIIGFIILYRYKNYKPGMLYPIMALMYAGTRFFWEFTRYYTYEQEKHFFLGMSMWQVCSVIVVILSVLWLYGIKHKWCENNNWLDNNNFIESIRVCAEGIIQRRNEAEMRKIEEKKKNIKKRKKKK